MQSAAVTHYMFYSSSHRYYCDPWLYPLGRVKWLPKRTTWHTRDYEFSGNERHGSNGVGSQARQLRQFPKLGWNSSVETIIVQISAQVIHAFVQEWEGGAVSCCKALDVRQ